MAKYAAVIPAAGLSSRMKAFKPLLRLGDKAMIDHAIDTFLAAGVDRVIVVAGYCAQALTEHLAARDVQVIVNPAYADSHMLDSIQLGLAALEEDCDGVYITPGDVPLFTRETVLALAASGYGAVRPVQGQTGGHPVFLRREAWQFVRTYAGANGLRGALEKLQAADLEIEDTGATLDADTPEAFLRLQGILAQREEK